MAEGTREAKNVSCGGILEPASPSLQNCIKFSNSGSYFSVLCDFGVVCVCDLKGKRFIIRPRLLDFFWGFLKEAYL